MPAFIGAEDDVVVLIGGRPFFGWVEVEVTQSFDKASGEGRLKITELPNDPFPARIGDDAVIIMANQPVLTGVVYSVDGNHDDKDHGISLTLRDKTQALVDSTLGPGVENKPPVSLKQIAQTTLGKMGIDIGVVDKVNPPKFEPAEVPVGDIEEFGYDYLDNWATKRQVVLNTDGKGNLVIDRNQGRTGVGMLYKARDRDDPLNNVLRGQYKQSLNDRYGQTHASGQHSTNDKDYWEGRPKSDEPAQAGPLSKNWGVENDSAIPSNRRRHFRAHAGLSKGSSKKAAKWRSSVAKARGFQYVGEVQGFEAAPGVLWWHGVIIPVRDDHFLLADMLFVTEVKFTKSLKRGAKTQVVCTYKDAFSEKGSSDSKSSRGAKEGIGAPQPTETAPVKMRFNPLTNAMEPAT